MSTLDPYELVSGKTEIRVRSAQSRSIDDQPMAQGRVVAYYGGPCYVIADAEGGQSTWLASLPIDIVPPLAKEPPTGGAAATKYTVWLHGHNGWFDGFDTADGSGDPIEFLSWEQLNQRHPEVRELIAREAS